MTRTGPAATAAVEMADVTPLALPLPPPSWGFPPHSPSLRAHEVHVWLASIDATERDGRDLASLLSPDELTRANRYRFIRDRDRCVARRGLLRCLLGSYLGVSPERIRFRYGAHGKPALVADGDDPALRFNVSDSHGLALYAFALDQELGVDIERINTEIATEEMARRFFTDREVEDLRDVPGPLRTLAFFRGWTRKEAYLKARGDGLSLGLNRFDVSLRPDEPAALRPALGGPDEIARFSFAELPPVEGFTAALCVGERASRLRCWRWPEP